jgi:DNA-binding NtrC family response regulator
MVDPSRELAPKSRILLVDDDEWVLFVLRASLQRMRMPCEVVTAQDGRAAYRLLQASAFDLLITDIRLPEIDGIILTDLVRSLAPRLPVIWVSAYGCRGLHEDAVRLRVFHCLEKPVEVEDFRRIVQQAISASFGEPTDGEGSGLVVHTGR